MQGTKGLRALLAAGAAVVGLLAAGRADALQEAQLDQYCKDIRELRQATRVTRDLRPDAPANERREANERLAQASARAAASQRQLEQGKVDDLRDAVGNLSVATSQLPLSASSADAQASLSDELEAVRKAQTQLGSTVACK